MKLSYSTRWLVCWGLFILAVFAVMAGIFSFAANWRQGLGLCLVGLGIAFPALWWLRHASRSGKVPRMKANTVLGILILGGGVGVFPWNSFAFSPGVNEEERLPRETDSVEVSRSATEETTSRSTLATLTSEKTSVMQEEETSAEVETAITRQPPETITRVETIVPPRATVYMEVPQEPAPQSSHAPTTSLSPEAVRPDVSESPDTASENAEPLPSPGELDGEDEPLDQSEDGRLQDGAGGAGYSGTGTGHQHGMNDQTTEPASEGMQKLGPPWWAGWDGH